MKTRNRIMGTLGMIAGLVLIVYGIMNESIPRLTDYFANYDPNWATYPRIGVIAFGGLMVLVGLYYVVIDFCRK